MSSGMQLFFFNSVVDSDYFFPSFLCWACKSSTGRKLELFYSILQAEEWEEVVEESLSEES